MRYVEVVHSGYMVVDVTRERLQGAWFYVDNVADPDGTLSFGAALSVADETAHLVTDDAPVPARASAPPLAP